MKRKALFCLPLLLLILFVFPLNAKADSESGQCGENVYWKISNDRSVMTIYGTGDMYPNFYGFRNDHGGIHISSYPSSIIIEEGVTSIGAEAFTYGSSGSW